MALTTIADLVFAGGVVIAALSLAGAALRRGSTELLASFALTEAVAAVGVWVVFAFRHERPVAVAAGGLTVCLGAAAGAFLLRSALRRVADIDARLAEARADLLSLVEQERSARATELELTLARARADSRSLLEEQERQLAEERRELADRREREAIASLTGKLTEVQAEVGQRLAAWSEELDQAADVVKERFGQLEQRSRQLVADLEQQVTANADRLAEENEEQRTALSRLRSELDRTVEETVAVARGELEAHSAERRRALHELEQRLSQREHELMEHAEREEAETIQRIRVGFEDVARRQVEQLERVVERAVAPHVDEAAGRFSQLVKTAREDAAKRLGRELDRAVGTFAREAETVLAERLAHIGDAGARRLERRITEVGGQLERSHEELVAAHEQRFTELEADVRRRMDELQADLEAERGILEARLQDVMRRSASAAADS